MRLSSTGIQARPPAGKRSGFGISENRISVVDLHGAEEVSDALAGALIASICELVGRTLIA